MAEVQDPALEGGENQGAQGQDPATPETPETPVSIYQRLGYNSEEELEAGYSSAVKTVEGLRAEMSAIKPIKVDFLSEVQDYVLREISEGKPVAEAKAAALRLIELEATDWMGRAAKDPVSVLVEENLRKYGAVNSREDIELVIRKRYGLDMKAPDPEDADAVELHQRTERTAMAQARLDASEAAQRLEAQKKELGLHPSIKAEMEARKANEQRIQALKPDFDTTLKDVASSFKVVAAGVEIPVQVVDKSGNLLPEHAWILNHNPLELTDPHTGRVSREKVANLLRVSAGAANLDAIVAAAIAHGKSQGTGATVDALRNNGTALDPNRSSKPGAPQALTELEKVRNVFGNKR